MDSDKVNRWLILVTNVGVLSGLILVAIQINQNTAITKAQLANDYYLADMQLELAMMGDEPVKSWIKAVYAPDDFSQEDAAIVDRYFNFGLIQIQRMEKMYELGLADEDWADRIIWLQWHLGNEIGRRWWAYERDLYPEKFANMVDDAMAAEGYQRNRRLLDSMLPQAESDQE